MSIAIRLDRKSAKKNKMAWEVDIIALRPDGSVIRERRRAPVKSKSGAEKWAKARESELIFKGKPQPETAKEKEVPTLEKFFETFIRDHAEANRQKPSSIENKRTVAKTHLFPRFGSLPLDEITDELVQKMKGTLAKRKAKTVNNILSALSVEHEQAL